jgi:hypothetical protein
MAAMHGFPKPWQLVRPLVILALLALWLIFAKLKYQGWFKISLTITVSYRHLGPYKHKNVVYKFLHCMDFKVLNIEKFFSSDLEICTFS